MNLEHLRHSLAHLLAAAVLDLYPDTKPTIGPAIENGFYYDFEFSQPISDRDLPKIEKRMKQTLKHWKEFSGVETSASDARAKFAHNQFKIELIDEIEAKGETITLYTSGEFTDLCRGGHIDNAKEINAEGFKLDRVAGAYWRGDETQPMLTRIYGLAFETKEELEAYLAQRKEAEKRDHRKLGKELDLYAMSELVGGGLPLFTPKGCYLRDTLAEYSQKLQSEFGFERVWTPHMARTELYKYSGHFDKYPERFEVTSAESDDVFMLKPMNCPHHAQLFARKPWSYRELPVRYMENTTNYRDEKHGELHGISRVRSLSQDDGHVFCRESDIEEEVSNIVRMIETLYSTLNLTYKARLSFRDDTDKYLGDITTWQRAEAIITKVAKDQNLTTMSGHGEAAFYGPKIDYMVYDALGREWQCATVQLDFVQPERFGLEYVDADGSKKRPVMIHKALLGSIERFLSVYIEHTAGAFPLWLSPTQAVIVPVSEKFDAYAQDVYQQMKARDIRVDLDNSNDTLGKRIRKAEQNKAPYILVVGEKEVADGTIAIRKRSEGDLGTQPIATFIEQLTKEINNKK